MVKVRLNKDTLYMLSKNKSTQINESIDAGYNVQGNMKTINSEKQENGMSVWPSIGFRYVFFIDMKTGKKYFRVFNMGNLKKYMDAVILEIVDVMPGMRPYISRMNFYFTTDEGIDTACTDFTAIYLNPNWIIRNIKIGNIPSAADFIVCDIPLEESTKIFSIGNGSIDMKDPDKFAEVAKNIREPHDFNKYDSDNCNLFTVIHELYHNLLQHKKRTDDFKSHYDYPTTHDHLNIITDQEINSYLLAFFFQNSFELVDNFKGIDYRKGNPVPEMNVSQEIHDFLYNTTRVPLLDLVDGKNGEPVPVDAKDENGHTIMLTVNFPKQTFEKMYPYFDEHNLWPLDVQPKKKRPGKDKQIVDHGTKVQQNEGDPQIYDSGYRDGYKDCVPNKELTSHEEYNNGYSDGVNAKVYDAENGGCQNEPDIIDTKSPGNATNESLKFYHRNYGKINESTDLNQDSSMDLDDSQPEDSSNHDRYNSQTIQVAPEGVDVPEGGNVIASGTPIGVGPGGISIGGKSAGAKHTGENSTAAPKNHIVNGYNGPSVSPAPHGYYNRHILLDKNGKPVPVDAKGGGGGGTQPGTQPVKNGKGGFPSSIPYGGTQSSDSMEHGLSGDMLTPEESAKIRKDLGLDEPSPTAQSDWQRSIKENGFANTPLGPTSPLVKQAKENDATSKGGGGLSGRQSGGLTEIYAAIQESMKSVVNWKRKLDNYLTGAFDNPYRRINKPRLGWERHYVEYETDEEGGESTGNILFFVDESGSISQNQLGQFFKEIRSMKNQLGMIENIFMVPFAGNNGCKVLKASVFKNGEVKAPLKSELTGGTDFPDLRYMTKGRIVNKVNMRPLWRSEYSDDFPVVTIILTDGEINLPNLLHDYHWHRDDHKLIMFVLNRNEKVRNEVKKWTVKNCGWDSFIGISTDDIV